MGGNVFKGFDGNSKRTGDGMVGIPVDRREFHVRFISDNNCVLRRSVTVIVNGGGNVVYKYNEIFDDTNYKRNNDMRCMVAVPVVGRSNGMKKFIHNFMFISLEDMKWMEYTMHVIKCNVYLNGNDSDIDKHMADEYRFYMIKFDMNLDNCGYPLSQERVIISIKIKFSKSLNELRKIIYKNIIDNNGKLKDEFMKYNINWNDIIMIYQNSELVSYKESIFDNIKRNSYYVGQCFYFKGMLLKRDDNTHKSPKYIINIFIKYNTYCYSFIQTGYFDYLSSFLPLDIVDIIKMFFMDYNHSNKIFNFGYITTNDISPENIQNQILFQLKNKEKIHENMSYIFPFKTSTGMHMRSFIKHSNYNYAIGPIISNSTPNNISHYGSKFISILLQKVKQPFPIEDESKAVLIHAIYFDSSYPTSLNIKHVKINQISLILNKFTQPDTLLTLICNEYRVSKENIVVSTQMYSLSFNGITNNDFQNILKNMLKSEQRLRIFMINKELFNTYKKSRHFSKLTNKINQIVISS